MKKAFSGRFGFDGVELRKLNHQVKNKATGTPHEGVAITRAVDGGQPEVCSFVDVRCCIYTSRGAIRVARFDLMGNAKALHRETSDRKWLHVLFYKDRNQCNIPLQELCGTNERERYARKQIYIFRS